MKINQRWPRPNRPNSTAKLHSTIISKKKKSCTAQLSQKKKKAAQHKMSPIVRRVADGWC
jgi:hypothetical protein